MEILTSSLLPPPDPSGRLGPCGLRRRDAARGGVDGGGGGGDADGDGGAQVFSHGGNDQFGDPFVDKFGEKFGATSHFFWGDFLELLGFVKKNRGNSP